MYHGAAMAENRTRRARGPASAAALALWATMGIGPGCAPREVWVEQTVRAPVADGRPVRLTRVRRGPEDMAVEVELRAPAGAVLAADLSRAALEVAGLAHLPVGAKAVTLAPGARRRLWLRYHLGRALHEPATVHVLDLRIAGAAHDPVRLTVPPAPGTADGGAPPAQVGTSP